MGILELSASTLGKIEIQGTVNHYICMIFYIISALQCSSLLQMNNGSYFWKALQYTYLNNIEVSVTVIIHTIVLFGFLICFCILMYQIKKTEKELYGIQTLTNFQIFLCKIINMKVLMFRTILVIPIVMSNLKAIQNQNSSFQTLGFINLIFFFLFIFPISNIKFLNCLPYFKSLTYPFTLNIVFVYNLYLPILVFLSQQSISKDKVWIINFIYVFLCSASLYLYPIVTFMRNQFFIGLISSIAWVSICSSLQQLNVASSINPLIVILVIPVVILSVIKIDDILIKRKLKTEEKNLKKLKIFVFCLMHYQIYQFQLESFLKMHQTKCVQKQCQCKNYKDSNKSSQFPILSSQQQFIHKKSLIHKILITQMRDTYFSRTLYSANNRIKEQISQIQQLSIYISEIELKILKKTKKAFTSLRQFQNFQQFKSKSSFIVRKKQEQFNGYGFKCLLMYNILKQEIGKKFEAQCKQSKNNYNLEASNFFSYQTKVQKYKKYIKQSVKNREFIWSQLKHIQPYNQKVTQAILMNLTYHKKIEELFRNLTKNYPEAIVEIFELTSLYCQMILNQDETQNQSILKILKNNIKQYHSKVSDAQINFFMANKMFSTLSKTAVCIMKADFDNFGHIQNANFYFDNKYLQPSNKNPRKANIFNLMIPELRHQHKIWIKQFVQENQNINFNHNNTFILNFEQKIETGNIFIQFKISIQSGLECEVFISSQKDEAQMLLMITDELEIKAQSRTFFQLKYQMMQGNSLSQYLTQKQKNVLKNHINDQKQKNLSYIELKFGNEDYVAQILKSIRIVKQVKIKEKQIQQNMMLYELKITSKDRFFSQNHRPLQMVNQLFNVQKNLHPTALQTFKIQQELKLIIEKSEQQNQLDQTYQIAMQKKQSKSIKNYCRFALLITFFIIITFCFGIWIVQHKKTDYNNGKYIINTFNQMRMTISQICFEIQTLKVYAYLNQTDVAQAAMQKLKHLNDKIKNLISPLAPYLTQKWLAYEVKEWGNIVNYKQSQYVIISDYLLTAITFISNQNISDLSFSFLYSHMGFPLNDIKIRYEEIYFNGYYTTVTGLTTQKTKIDLMVNDNIVSLKYQYLYITAIIGSLICLAFFVFSLRIQKKFDEVIKLNFSLIQNIDMKSVTQKIKNLKMFKESKSYSKILNRRINWKKSNLSQMISNTIYAYNIPYNENTTERQFLDPQNGGKQLQKDSLTYQQNMQIKAQNQLAIDLKPNSISKTNKTNQKFSSIHNNLDNLDNIKSIQSIPISIKNLAQEKSYTNLDDYQLENQEDGKKKSHFKVAQSNPKINLILLLSISLFFAFCFITAFISQIIFSEKFSYILKVNSQLLQRKIWLLGTLLDLYVTPTLQVPGFNLFEYLMPNITDAYANQRRIYNYAQSFPGSNFQRLLHQMADNSICDYVDLFPPSIYFNITLSKNECQNFIMSKPLTHGVKASYVYYQQTAVQQLNMHKIPSDMTYQQRIQFYKTSQIKQQLIFYAYLNQAGKLVQTAFQADTSQIVHDYTIANHTLTAFMILFSLVFSVYIKYRIKKLKISLDIVKSIYILISYKTFKTKKILGNTPIIEKMKFLN